jgi:hypothetical protein
MLCFIFSFAQNNTNNLVRIPYNNPELESVDLGVGLWAWPFPVDYDNDGDLDLLVNCPDKPFNGLWLFENTTKGKNPVLKPPVQTCRKSAKPANISMEREICSHNSWCGLSRFSLIVLPKSGYTFK